MMQRIFMLFMAMILVAGCATTTKESMLNLSYNTGVNSPKQDVKVALVRPRYTALQAAREQLAQSPLMGLMESQMEKMLPPDQKLKAKYTKDYLPVIQNSMRADTEKIILAKGFNLHRSFDSIDEITYSDKKNVDLIIEPQFDISPIIANKRECSYIPLVGQRCSDSGTIQMNGKLKFNFIEPLSKEIIITKALDIATLGYDNSVSYSNTQSAHDILADLLNSLYPKLMVKIENAVDIEEAKQALQDIRHLKEKNK